MKASEGFMEIVVTIETQAELDALLGALGFALDHAAPGLDCPDHLVIEQLRTTIAEAAGL